MIARWACFAAGLWLVLAPLVLGYGSLGPILHGVAVGTLVCIGALAAIEWPASRFALALPAVWLLVTGPRSADVAAAAAEVAAGALLLVAFAWPARRARPCRAASGASISA